MSVCCDREWKEQQLAYYEQLILKLQTAIDALTVGGVDMYQLDTGQTRTYVQRSRVPQLQQMLSMAESRREMLRKQLNGCGAFVMRPIW